MEIISIGSASIFTSIPESSHEELPHSIIEENIMEWISWAYFDGASSHENKCRAGLIIHLNPHKSLKSSVGLGNETNNFAELTTLKLLLFWLIHLGISMIQIFEDSLNTIKWFNGSIKCHNYMLSAHLEETMHLKSHFNIISLCHIYRERNDAVD